MSPSWRSDLVGLSEMIAQLVIPVEHFAAAGLRAREAAALVLRHVAPILAWTTERASATVDLTRQTICTGRLSCVWGNGRAGTTGLRLGKGWCWKRMAKDVHRGVCLGYCHGGIVAVVEIGSVVPIICGVILGIQGGIQNDTSIVHEVGADWIVLVQEISNGISIDLIIRQLR
jgi:hypothetical protein